MFTVAEGTKLLSVSSNGVTLATITIPAGILVSIYSDHPATRGPQQTFLGRIEVRARNASGLPATYKMEDVMASAPVVLSVSDEEVTLSSRSR
jgi:hypothetical protein